MRTARCYHEIRSFDRSIDLSSPGAKCASVSRLTDFIKHIHWFQERGIEVKGSFSKINSPFKAKEDKEETTQSSNCIFQPSTTIQAACVLAVSVKIIDWYQK